MIHLMIRHDPTEISKLHEHENEVPRACDKHEFEHMLVPRNQLFFHHWSDPSMIQIISNQHLGVS